MRRYTVWVQETISRSAEVPVELRDDQNNSDAERIAKERLDAGEALPWSEPKTCIRFSGFYTG